MKKSQFSQEIYVNRLRPRTKTVSYGGTFQNKENNCTGADLENGVKNYSNPAKVFRETNSAADSLVEMKTQPMKRKLTDENYAGSKNEKASSKKLKVDPTNVRSFDPIELQNQETAEMQRKKGNDLFKAGKFNDARLRYSLAILLCPNNAIYYGNRAACFLKLNDFASCLKDSRRSVELDDKFVKGHVRIIKCHLALGEIEAAEYSINRVVALNGKTHDIFQEEQQFKMLLDLNTKIYDSYDVKDFSSCLAVIDAALEIATYCRRYKVLKAECLCYCGRMTDAHNIVVTSLISPDPNQVDINFLNGLIAYYSSNFVDTVKNFMKVLDQDPKNEKTKNILNRASTLEKKVDEGIELFRNRKYTEFITSCTEAMKIDPLHQYIITKLYFYRGRGYSKLGLFTEAVNDYSEALKLHPNFLKALVKRAHLYFELKKYKDCANDCEAALEIDKNYPEVQKLFVNAKVKIRESIKNYYHTLGVSYDATLREIREAYHRLALIHHPDRHTTSNTRTRQQHEVMFKEIGQAYSVLSNPAKRKNYDYRFNNDHDRSQSWFEGDDGHGYSSSEDENSYISSEDENDTEKSDDVEEFGSD